MPACLLDEEMAERCRDYVENYKEYGHEIPSVSGMSRHLGVSRGTIIVRWKQHSPDIINPILDDLQAEQELALLNGGLNKKFNANIAGMLLTKHGYSTKSEVNHTSSDGSMTPKGASSFYATLEENDDE